MKADSPKKVSPIDKLAKGLFDDVAVRASFLEALSGGGKFPTAVVWVKDRPEPMPFPTLPSPDWLPKFVDLVSPDIRPGKHPLHDQGYYYCLDPSSVFSASVVSDLNLKDSKVCDLCAAPGGKSVLLSKFLSPSLLVSNETIGKRLGALISNLKRCEISNSQVVSADPSVVTQAYGGEFDVVFVDAPCSGQSLLAKGDQSPGCFHPATINLNSNRQKRILANALGLLRSGGFLAYSTCTFSIDENEKVVEWLVKKFPGLTSLQVPLLNEYQSNYSDLFCYRIFPMSKVGAGAFAALFSYEPSELERVSGSGKELKIFWSSIEGDRNSNDELRRSGPKLIDRRGVRRRDRDVSSSKYQKSKGRRGG